MNASEFISLATNLAANGKSGPSGYRTAVSRAYYGTYHLAKQLLKEIGYDAGSVHGEVPKGLARTKNTDLEDASRLLNDLHGRRRGADYDIDDPACETQSFAKFSLDMANDIVATLQSCNGNPAVLSALKSKIAEFKSRK